MEPTILIAIMTLGAAAVASIRGEKPIPTGPEEHGMNDLDLWNRVYTSQDVLIGTSFERAVLEDPRRVFGMIEQTVFDTLQDVYPLDREAIRLQLAMHLEKSDFLRRTHDGALPLSALVTFEDAYAPVAMEMSLRGFPDEVKAAFRHNIGAISGAYDRAADIASQAARVASEHGRGIDALAWAELAATVDRTGDRLLVEFTGAQRLPGGIEGMMLPGATISDDEVNG
jgi:hypothetical protein